MTASCPAPPGNDSIATELEEATVAILLVSKHFLSSVYIARKELPEVLKRRVADGLKLLWIPIGNVESALQGELAAIRSVCPLARASTSRATATSTGRSSSRR